MDEVRLWKTVRTQDDILKHMRWASGLENHADLAAYWKFNDPDEDNGQFRRHMVAKDSSGKGNDLSLLNPPFRADVEIKQGENTLHTGKLEFKNNLAVDKNAKGMPDKSFTVEFWAKGRKLGDDQDTMVRGGGRGFQKQRGAARAGARASAVGSECGLIMLCTVRSNCTGSVAERGAPISHACRLYGHGRLW